MRLIIKQKWALQFLLLLMFITRPIMADVNILVIGSPSDSSWSTFQQGTKLTAAFDPAGVITELTNILEGTGETNVNVAFEDFTGTVSNLWYHRNLFSWFHYPYPFNVGPSERWPNLRGELGTEWDYVVLIGDAHSIEHIPGVYALGVSEIAKEVAKGTAETVLLMPWPSEFGVFGRLTDSTVEHYKEVVYRVGRSGGCMVAPAGLVWEASGELGDSVNQTHPTDNGAYIAAATLYSRIYGENAATASSYERNDTLATLAYETVNANRGATQYTGKFATEHPHKAQFNTNRNVNFSITGTSTERGHIENVQVVLDECRVKHSSHFSHRYNTDDPIAEGAGWPTDEDGNPLGPIDYNFGKFGFSAYEEFNVNPNFWKRAYIFRYQSFVDETTSRARIVLHDMDSAVRAYVQSPPAGALIPMGSLAMLNRLRPNIEINGSGNHLTDLAILPNATFMNTVDSGRCPLTPETENPSDQWVAMKVGYEAGWIMSNLQARAPGFRVLPSSADKQEINNYETSGAEDMSVQFIFEPKKEVTVHLTSSHPGLISISPSTLTFTPENHDTIQFYNVSIANGAATTEEEITVNVTTTSEDEVYNELSDSWTYTAKSTDTESLPVAVKDDYRTGVNTELTTNVNTGVTANDITNPQIAINQVSLISDVSNGTLNLNTDGSFTYNPNTDFDGRDTFTYSISNANGSSDEVTVNIAVSDLDPSLIVWYDFEEIDGTTVKDLTAYGRDGTMNGSIPQVAGVAADKFGIDLSSADGTIDIPIDQEYLDLLDDNTISIAFWGKLNPLAATNNNSNSSLLRGSVGYGPDRYNTLNVRFQTRTQTNIVDLWWELGIYTQGAANDLTGIPNGPSSHRLRIVSEDSGITAAETAGQWVHWTFSRIDNGFFEIHMNGVRVGGGGLAGLLAIARVDELDELVMGNGYNGNIDDFRIYNRGISAAEITQIMLETAPPQPQSWTGNAAGDNLWATPGNWSLGESPRIGSILELSNGGVIDFPSGVTILESSTVSLLDGELALGQGASLNLDANAIFRIAGGSVTKDFADTTSDINFDGDATSLIEISSGSIQVVNGETGDFTELRSNIVVSGGDIDLSGQPRLRGNLTVRGSAATIDMEQLRTFTGAVFNFELDESGVSSINVNGATNIQDSSLFIDGSAYTGGDATIPLINAFNLQNVIPDERVTVTGLEDRGYFVEVIQDRGTDDVVIAITADTADTDNDGYLDWEEAIMGTDPADASSKLETAVVQTEAGLTLSWPTVSGRTYIVERSDDLNTWEVYRDNIPFTPGDDTAVEILAEAESESRMFYRVRVQN